LEIVCAVGGWNLSLAHAAPTARRADRQGNFALRFPSGGRTGVCEADMAKALVSGWVMRRANL
jgi:hypothetical protein